MGAEGESETESKAVEPSSYYSPEVIQKLDQGWFVSATEDGQLLLIPPTGGRGAYSE